MNIVLRPDPLESLNAATGAAVWLAESVLGGHPVAPPPTLAQCFARRRYLRASARYNGTQRLDIWCPERPVTPTPTLVFIPGGAWVVGHRRPQGYALMSYLVEHGWVCVAVDYRVSPRHRWPAHLEDVRAALRWVRAHIADYGGDPDLVAVAGASAGGHLAALAALTFDEPTSGIPRPAAVVSLYGVYDWAKPGVRREFLERVVVGRSARERPDIFYQASPVAHVRCDAPPFLLIHGTADRIVPVSEARAFHRILAGASSAASYLEIHGAGHAFDAFDAAATGKALKRIGQFFSEVHGGYITRAAQVPAGA
jgi:acetyl esterase/lipase